MQLGDAIGQGRFRLEHVLGSGTFGTVYQAQDLHTTEAVALKVLHHLGADSLMRFKREFRALSALRHPNLVRIFELHEDEGAWFFSMELVRGQMLASALGTPGTESVTPRPADPPASHTYEFEEGRPVDPVPARRPWKMDEGRIRAVFGQIAEGVAHLHAQGMLHRDLKPANIMVGRDGRVIILDFGLVVDLGGEDRGQQTTVAGTPLYMAPEQARNTPIGPPADWYAVGALLYTALTGRLPFDGSHHEVLVQKGSRPPTPPSEIFEGIPSDLDQLCIRLLSVDPASRPAAEEVLAALGEVRPTPVEEMDDDHTLVGRRVEVEQLLGLVAHVADRRAAVALVRGRSGMGKTRLIERFVQLARQGRPDLVVLPGRCFPQESVPYKTIDAVVDALARVLRRMDRGDVDALLPRDAWALPRMFPVLGGVAAIAACEPRRPTQDPLELRRRATTALRELLVRLGARRTVVMIIDDVQWGDVDGARLLQQLIAPPQPPDLLVVLAYRAEEADAAPLQLLVPAVRAASLDEITVQEVVVDRLLRSEAEVLARQVGARHGGITDAQVAGVVRDADGSPFMVQQLAAFGARVPATALGGSILGAMLDARLEALSAAARHLLTLVCLEGRPLPERVMYEAAGVAADREALEEILTGGLVEERRHRHERRVSHGHDRLREHVLGWVTDTARVEGHRALAAAWARHDQPDADTLAMHLRAAGDVVAAAPWARQAAEAAVRALAFDRAAALFQEALDGATEAEAGLLHAELAHALASLGRVEASADAYRRAIALESDPQRRHYLGLSLSSLLFQLGRSDEALHELRSALRGIGHPAPPVWIALGWGLWMFWRLLRTAPTATLRPSSEIPTEAIRRHDALVDACFSVVIHYRPYALFVLASRIRESVALGEPTRLRSGLANLYLLKVSLALRATSPSLLALRERVEPGPPSDDITIAEADTWLALGAADLMRCDVRGALPSLKLAEAVNAERPGPSKTTRMRLNKLSLATALLWAGDYQGMADQALGWSRDARLRGDLEGMHDLVECCTVTRLAFDLQDEAWRQVLDEAASITPSSSAVALAHTLRSAVWVALYRSGGLGPEALSWLDAQPRYWTAWSWRYQDPQMLRFREHAIAAALIAAAATSTGAHRTRLLARARAIATPMARQAYRIREATGLLLLACIAGEDGDVDGCRQVLAATRSVLEETGLDGLAPVVRLRLAELDGDAVAAAEAFEALRRQGVADPQRFAAVWAPGSWRVAHAARQGRTLVG